MINSTVIHIISDNRPFIKDGCKVGNDLKAFYLRATVVHKGGEIK